MQAAVKRVSRRLLLWTAAPNDVLIGAVGAGGMAPSAQWSDEICIHNALTKVIGPQPPLAPFIAPGAPAAPAR
jgi:hypothetical protein